jgi:transcriptional regulator with XRE-family HTH domain
MATTKGLRRPGRRKADGPNPIDVHVGSRVRLRRTTLGLSQEKLAHELGLTFQQIQKYERGANRIGASRLYEIATVLGVEPQSFYDGLKPVGEAAAGMGFAEGPQAGFDSDPLRRGETVELVNAYFDIEDTAVRRRFLDLARALVSGGQS